MGARLKDFYCTWIIHISPFLGRQWFCWLNYEYKDKEKVFAGQSAPSSDMGRLQMSHTCLTLFCVVCTQPVTVNVYFLELL
jgi:hypothetical protein